jgi:hypothetical protein
MLNVVASFTDYDGVADFDGKVEVVGGVVDRHVDGISHLSSVSLNVSPHHWCTGRRHDTQHNDIQLNNSTTVLSPIMLSVVFFIDLVSVFMLSVFLVNVIVLRAVAPFRHKKLECLSLESILRLMYYLRTGLIV